MIISFQWPWLLLLFPLVFFIKPRISSQKQLLQVPFLSRLQAYPDTKKQHSYLSSLLLAVIWLCLLLAAARPQLLGERIQLPLTGRDLMLAVDISGSMQRTDMHWKGQTINRLDVVKKVLDTFITQRQGDRIGLILFADQAYLQAPLTYDRNTVKTLMQEAEVGMAGKSTALGSAIGQAIKHLKDIPNKSRVLILITDGANTSGKISPLQATQLAQQIQLRIYTIGVGSDTTTVSTLFGQRQINPASDLDETTLQTIAQLTGGQYFRAKNSQALIHISEQLDKLEPVHSDKKSYRPLQELFYLPLSIVLCFLLLLLIKKTLR